MKKTLLCLAIAISAGFATAANAAADLFNFVPEKANAIIYLKFNEIINHPALKEARSKNMEFSKKYDEIEAKFGKFNIKIEDLASDMLVFREGEDDAGVVLKTGITEAKLKEIIASDIFVQKNGGKIQESKMAGRKVFVISSPIKGNDIPNNSIDIDNESVLTYLDKNTVLVTEKNCFEKIVKEISKSNVLANKEMMSLKKDVNTSSATAWAVFVMPPKEKAAPAQPAGAQQPPAFMNDPADSVKGGCFAVELAGKEKNDIIVDVLLECDTEQSASMMAMQAQGLIMLGSGTMFQKNPQLGMKVGSAIKINSSGKNLSAKLNFPKTLMDEIKKHAEDMKKQPPLQMGPQVDIAPAPAGTGASK